MRFKRLALGTFVAIVAIVLFLTSFTTRDNEEYIDYLASLVVRYQQRHGSPPDGFEAAHLMRAA